MVAEERRVTAFRFQRVDPIEPGERRFQVQANGVEIGFVVYVVVPGSEMTEWGCRPADLSDEPLTGNMEAAGKLLAVYERVNGVRP